MTTPVHGSGDSSLERGRAAAARRAWREAYELLSAADAAEALAAADLEPLAESAFWIGRYDECIRSRERSVAAHLKAGSDRDAARVALALAGNYFGRRNISVGSGWFNKAKRLLEPVEEGPEHGELANWESHLLIAMGELDLALDAARRTYAIGRRFGSADLQAHSLSAQGSILIRQGHVGEGMALIDESMASAVGGELSAWSTAAIFCTTMSACHRIGDYRRAAEWTQAAEACARKPGMADFPGDCRVHRVAILRMQGTWAEAQRQAEKALVEAEPFDLGHVGMTYYEMGEIQLRMGDLGAAADAFRHADELGRLPQPGLALLRLAEGDAAAAAASIASALTDESWDSLARARLLPAAVEIALAAHSTERAQAAVDELERIAETYGTSAHKATFACAQGRLQLARGEAEAAATSLRRGGRLWQEVEVPYEAARARAALADALHASGDADACKLELRTALAVFERLGAMPDVERSRRLLDELEAVADAQPAASERLVRTFMFTDIVQSTNLTEAMGDEAWSAVLRWHDQTLRSQFASHGGEEIKHVGDGFFVAFAEAAPAVECAVAIQRALATHRREHGFSPEVRIGLHAAEATREGDDYHGKGVNQAARIGAIAKGGEVLASDTTLAGAARSFPTLEPATVTLKGMSEPVTVVGIAWR